MLWENVGVAPPYGDYRLAYRLSGPGPGEPAVAVSDRSIRGWLPGRLELADSFRLPRSVVPGRYRLALGVVDPRTKKPAVALAIAGRDAEGWYPLSEVEVVRRRALPPPAGAQEPLRLLAGQTPCAARVLAGVPLRLEDGVLRKPPAAHGGPEGRARGRAARGARGSGLAIVEPPRF